MLLVLLIDGDYHVSEQRINQTCEDGVGNSHVFVLVIDVVVRVHEIKLADIAGVVSKTTNSN